MCARKLPEPRAYLRQDHGVHDEALLRLFTAAMILLEVESRIVSEALSSRLEQMADGEQVRKGERAGYRAGV